MTAPIPEIPFHSKSQHVANAIRQSLKRGVWQEQLPGENRLASEFNVSRPTVRQALDILTADGVLLPAEVGRGRKVSSGWKETTARTEIPVGVLTRRPLGMLMPSAQNTYRELRTYLERKGCQLTFETSAAWGKKNPGKLLRKVMDQHPMRAWVVGNPTPAMEQWLEKSGVPCLCVGGSYQHRLPRIGSEGDDTIRWATRELIEHGHREIFYPVHEEYGVQMMQPFLEEMETVGSGSVDPRHTPRWGGEAVECFAMLERLFAGPRPPTAFVTLGLVNLLPILTWLGGKGHVVPRDVSIIQILADPILDQLYPPITHYRGNNSKLVRESAKLVMKLVGDGEPFDKEVMVPMSRVDGRSVAPPPSG